jgi:hypothetical protein
MSMNYFKPTELQQLEATYNFTARAGLGFAITPDNEQVFLSVVDVQRYALEVGDTLRVWATDNYASEHTKHHPSRWRAVRVEVLSRVADVVRDIPNIPEPTKTHPTDFVGVFTSVLEQLRPWTVQELTQAVAKQSVPPAALPDLLAKVTGRLLTLHKNGEIACIKVYARGDQERASAVYYAKNVDVFYEHLDTPLNDEE